MKFTDYEIPINSLLSKFTKMDENGNVEENFDKNAQKLTYGAMMALRTNLTRMYTAVHSGVLALDNTFKEKKGTLSELEKREWIDELSYHWNWIMVSKYSFQVFRQFQEYYKEDVKKAIKMVKDLHFLASGLKAFSSYGIVHNSREKSSNNPLGNLVLTSFNQLYSDYVPAVTYEGDNTVLIQQVMQITLLYFNQLKTGKKVKGLGSFLNRFQKYVEDDLDFEDKIKFNSADDVMLHGNDLMENFAYLLLNSTIKKFQQAVFVDDIPIKVVMSDTLQNELVHLGNCFF
mmetsp:Transcript_16726/g.14619  ORF Transcript_16726/g.14619 Transcript_16726/m.14619 type:complete len:288 (-) Transcript_16726:556-1419(-)